MLLAALSGAYLFAVKHHAQVLDDQFATITQLSRLDAQRIRVLQAQWALEIDPTRLTQLAAQFTRLQPMKPAQLVALADLRDDLPQPGSAAPVSNPQAPAVAVPNLGNLPVAEQNATLPLPPPQAPARMAVASLDPSRRQEVSRPLARRTSQASHPVQRMANSQLAETLPPPRPLYARLYAQKPVPQLVPMGAQLMSVKASAVLPEAVPEMASTAAASAQPEQNSGSALGMGADLAPPQPLPQALPPGGMNN
jgi:hypothetical protein